MNEIMKITINFLRGLAIGTDITLEDVENVTSVPPLCTKLKRTEGKVSFNLKTYPLERKVRIQVKPYGNGQRFQDASPNEQGSAGEGYGT